MELSFSWGFKELLKSQYLSSEAILFLVIDCPFFHVLMACKLNGSLICRAGFQKQENRHNISKCTQPVQLSGVPINQPWGRKRAMRNSDL